MSQRKRRLVEEAFGWGKTVGQMRERLPRGLARVAAEFTRSFAAYTLARLPGLLAA